MHLNVWMNYHYFLSFSQVSLKFMVDAFVFHKNRFGALQNCCDGLSISSLLSAFVTRREICQLYVENRQFTSRTTAILIGKQLTFDSHD